MTEIFPFIYEAAAGLSAAAVFFALFAGTFISEDAACIAAGAAAANGNIGFGAAVVACLLGIFVGDLLLFGAGRLMGSRVFGNRLTRRFVTAESISKARAWLERNTASAIFLSRFASGLRLPTYVAAGALRIDTTKFAVSCLVAAALWTPLLVGSVAFAGSTFLDGRLLVIGVVAVVLLRCLAKLLTWKGRRLMIGRIRRVANWEFWPLFVFYAPVIVYVLILALRFRGLTLFTAANPALPAGGFKGESKYDIYELLARSRSIQNELPAYTLVKYGRTPDDRMRAATQFIEERGLDFPVVVKPDVGERGKGVRTVRSLAELETTLRDSRGDMILQEYVDGVEVSAFYYRRPNEPRGKIFSVTEKRFPAVVGDGRSTLERLILADKRAVCLAGKYLEHNRGHIHEIPKRGEFFPLIDIGTHSRGAIFLDGGHLITSDLEARIDALCRGVSGFFFGRFDLRAPSLEDLKAGVGIKIIELNGVTSESTNIYDPRYSLMGAYRVLFKQWRLAFEIGAQNVKLGERRAGIVELVRITLGLRPRDIVCKRSLDGAVAADRS